MVESTKPEKKQMEDQMFPIQLKDLTYELDVDPNMDEMKITGTAKWTGTILQTTTKEGDGIYFNWDNQLMEFQNIYLNDVELTDLTTSVKTH